MDENMIKTLGPSFVHKNLGFFFWVNKKIPIWYLVIVFKEPWSQHIQWNIIISFKNIKVVVIFKANQKYDLFIYY
jgi:hypothetical protein